MLSNYGAVLQCYALQKYLSNDRNLDVEVIDFTTEKHLKALSVFNHTISNPLIRFGVNIFVLSKYRQLKLRRKRTVEFKTQNIPFSKRYSSVEEILGNPPKKDYYISGSDQVFNLNSDYYRVYYLDFNKGEAKKIAYAPSFGHSNFNDEFWNKIRGFIEDFDALSCREDTGARFLSEHTSKDVPVVVDPSLLLSKEEWKQVAISPTYKKKYIFIYDLNGGEQLVQIALQLQKQTGYDIVCLTNNIMQRYKVNKQMYDAGPAEFLGWIANAECVVTDSFHGAVFSIINNKPFYTYIAIPELATRIMNLISITSLQSRIVSEESINDIKWNPNITINTARLEDIIQSSKNFISTIFKD